MFKWLSKYRAKQGINDLPSEEERERLRPPPPSPTNARKPLIPANHSLFDDEGKEFFAVRDIYAGDIVKAEDFLYMDGTEFKVNSLLPLCLLKYVLGKRFH